MKSILIGGLAGVAVAILLSPALMPYVVGLGLGGGFAIALAYNAL